MVVPAPRPADRQRPARVHALLHRVPRLRRAHRWRRDDRRCNDASTSRCWRRVSRPSRIGRVGLPAPAHLAPSLAGYRHLTPARQGARRCAPRCASGAVDPDGAATDQIAFGDWLAEHGQGEQAIAALWDLIGRPTMNVRGARRLAGARRQGVPHRPARVGRRRPTSAGRSCRSATLHDELPARRPRRGRRRGRDRRAGAVGRRGGRRLRRPRRGRPAMGRRRGGRRPAPPGRRRPCSPPGALAPGVRAGAARSIPDRQRPPGVRPEGDRLPFAAAIGSPVQFLFDRTAPPGCAGPGQYLAISLSAADAEVDQKASDARRRDDGGRRRAAAEGRARPSSSTPWCRASGRPRSAACPAPPPTARRRRRRSRASCWPARGRPPGGRPRWRARCAAAGRRRPRRSARPSRHVTGSAA